MVDETELEQPSTAPVQNQDEQAQSSSADSETENELLSVVQSAISEILPKRLTQIICENLNIQGKIVDISNKLLNKLSLFINSWRLNPIGTEGYRTAEVTLGGVDTDEISSKTMMSNKHSGLFFIGEVVDVTGHLGGYNFQWAWSSGYVAGQYT